MKKAERRLVDGIQPLPVRSRNLQQSEGPDEVGLDKRGWPLDRSVNVTFGCKVHQCAGPILAEKLLQCGEVADIDLEEFMPRIEIEPRESCAVACVGELIDVDDPICSRIR